MSTPCKMLKVGGPEQTKDIECGKPAKYVDSGDSALCICQECFDAMADDPDLQVPYCEIVPGMTTGHLLQLLSVVPRDLSITIRTNDDWGCAGGIVSAGVERGCDGAAHFAVDCSSDEVDFDLGLPVPIPVLFYVLTHHGAWEMSVSYEKYWAHPADPNNHFGPRWEGSYAEALKIADTYNKRNQGTSAEVVVVLSKP